MVQRVFCVYDSAARSYGPPFYATGRGVAFRMFEELVNDGRSSVSKWPKDFSLFELGSYNDETAKFCFLDAPERVCDAMSLKRPQAEEPRLIPIMREGGVPSSVPTAPANIQEG